MRNSAITSSLSTHIIWAEIIDCDETVYVLGIPWFCQGLWHSPTSTTVYQIKINWNRRQDTGMAEFIAGRQRVQRSSCIEWSKVKLDKSVQWYSTWNCPEPCLVCHSMIYRIGFSLTSLHMQTTQKFSEKYMVCQIQQYCRITFFYCQIGLRNGSLNFMSKSVL